MLAFELIICAVLTIPLLALLLDFYGTYRYAKKSKKYNPKD